MKGRQDIHKHQLNLWSTCTQHREPCKLLARRRYKIKHFCSFKRFRPKWLPVHRLYIFWFFGEFPDLQSQQLTFLLLVRMLVAWPYSKWLQNALHVWSLKGSTKTHKKSINEERLTRSSGVGFCVGSCSGLQNISDMKTSILYSFRHWVCWHT